MTSVYGSPGARSPHLARVLLQPEHDRLRVSFPDLENANAFRELFGSRLN